MRFKKKRLSLPKSQNWWQEWLFKKKLEELERMKSGVKVGVGAGLRLGEELGGHRWAMDLIERH